MGHVDYPVPKMSGKSILSIRGKHKSEKNHNANYIWSVKYAFDLSILGRPWNVGIAVLIDS